MACLSNTRRLQCDMVCAKSWTEPSVPGVHRPAGAGGWELSGGIGGAGEGQRPDAAGPGGVGAGREMI